MKSPVLLCALLLPLAACHDPEQEAVLTELRGLRSDLSGPRAESVGSAQVALKPLADAMQVLLTEQRSLRQRQSVLTDEMTRFTDYLERGAASAATPQNPEELKALRERLTRLEQELAKKDAEHREVEEMLRGALETTSLQLEAFLKQVEAMNTPVDPGANTEPGKAGDGKASEEPKKGAVGGLVDRLREDAVTQWSVIAGLVLLLWFAARLWMARRPRREMDAPIPSQELFGHDDPGAPADIHVPLAEQAADFDIESESAHGDQQADVHGPEGVDDGLYVIDVGNRLDDDVPEAELDREFADSIREVEAMRLFPSMDDVLDEGEDVGDGWEPVDQEPVAGDVFDDGPAEREPARQEAAEQGINPRAPAELESPERGDAQPERPEPLLPEPIVEAGVDAAAIRDVECEDVPEIQVTPLERPTIEPVPMAEPAAAPPERPALHLVPPGNEDDTVARLMVPGTDRAGATSQLREAVAREPWVVQQPPPQVEVGDGVLEATLRFLPETPVAERGRILARARRALS